MLIKSLGGITGFQNNLPGLSSRHQKAAAQPRLLLKTRCWKAGLVTPTGQHVSVSSLVGSYQSRKMPLPPN